MQCGKIVISGETGVGQVLVWKIFVLWFLCLLALQSSAWAQRHGRHAGYRPGHFGARQPSFQGRAPGFHGNHPGYGRPGLVYRFPSHRPYRFSPSYGAFRHYRPYPQYPRRYFYVGPRVYPFVPFRYGIPPYPYHSGFADPYWPGIGYSSLPSWRRAGPGDWTRTRNRERPHRAHVAAGFKRRLDSGGYGLLAGRWHAPLPDSRWQIGFRSLSELDLSYTLQLNRERRLDFRLPKPPAE